MKKAALSLLLLASLAACDVKQQPAASSQAASSPVAAVEPPPPKRPTQAEFRAALTGTYTESRSETDGEGRTKFSACFDAEAGPKCANKATAWYDSFSQSWHFEPYDSAIAGKLGPASQEPWLQVGISAGLCEAPILYIKPGFVGPKWLFMRQVAFLADDSVVLSEKFDASTVTRENRADGVVETVLWPMVDDDVARLRSISSAERVIVRMTGENTYAVVPQDFVGVFKKSLPIALHIYDRLTAAIDVAGGPECTESPKNIS